MLTNAGIERGEIPDVLSLIRNVGAEFPETDLGQVMKCECGDGDVQTRSWEHAAVLCAWNTICEPSPLLLAAVATVLAYHRWQLLEQCVEIVRWQIGEMAHDVSVA